MLKQMNSIGSHKRYETIFVMTIICTKSCFLLITLCNSNIVKDGYNINPSIPSLFTQWIKYYINKENNIKIFKVKQ